MVVKERGGVALRAGNWREVRESPITGSHSLACAFYKKNFYEGFKLHTSRAVHFCILYITRIIRSFDEDTMST